MIKKYSRIISETQSKYKINIESKNVTQQSSYNLVQEMEDYLINKKMIVKQNANVPLTEFDYDTASGVSLILGDSIIAIIGTQYKGASNKVIFTHTEGHSGTSKKLQLKRKKFNSLGSDYKWFVDLYDKNIEGMNFVTLIDDVANTITFDLELSSELMSGAPSIGDVDNTFPTVANKHELNQILYGAPGTGKTYSTAVYALAIIENITKESVEAKYLTRQDVMTEYRKNLSTGKIRFTTFHQNYSYEDFIQGLRPDLTTPMKFNYVDGIFKSIASDAVNDSANNYVLIIDEINRANISKVFGELITLIEPDKRKCEVNEIELTLPSGDNFSVPNNLYILGTMNLADKSISLIDAALRRRFKFIEVAPNSNLITDATLKETLEKINKELYKRLKSTDLLVGHSYFIGKTIDDLEEIMNDRIIPLLYEYFFDNKDKVKEVLNASLDAGVFDIEESEVMRLKIKKK